MSNPDNGCSRINGPWLEKEAVNQKNATDLMKTDQATNWKEYELSLIHISFYIHGTSLITSNDRRTYLDPETVEGTSVWP